MCSAPTSKPIVLALSGHDPCGGAGIQADIEAIASGACHPVSALTCLTVQNTSSFRKLYPVAADCLRAQAESLLEDMPVAACKIGLIPDVSILDAILAILKMITGIPVVFDPVLASGTGTSLAGQELIHAMREKLCSMTSIATPNSIEARRLSGSDGGLEEAAGRLIDFGCEYVLVTGTHEDSQMVVNHLYHQHELIDRMEWERLPGVYHGSGCTLSAAIAAELAHGKEPIAAVRNAQAYTWRTLQCAYVAGRGHKLPGRVFWPDSGSPR